MPDADHLHIPDEEPYFNTNLNKGCVNILNGQFKFTSKYTLQGDLFKLPSNPIYIHMIVKVDGSEPVNLDVKMDMNVSIRFIDGRQPSFNPFAPDADTNKLKPTFYDGYKDNEYYERRQQFRDQNKPVYDNRPLSLIDLPGTNKEYFGIPEKNATSAVNNFAPDVDFRRTKNTDLTPYDPFGR